MYDGPSYVFVEEFNVDEGGTIAFELSPATSGTQPVGTYPQVFADVANLEGTLEARFITGQRPVRRHVLRQRHRCRTSAMAGSTGHSA